MVLWLSISLIGLLLYCAAVLFVLFRCKDNLEAFTYGQPVIRRPHKSLYKDGYRVSLQDSKVENQFMDESLTSAVNMKANRANYRM